MSEVWKTIPGYDLCQVSDQGRVRGSSGRVLKQQAINSGYFIVHLCEQGVRRAYTVHRLVAIAFLPPVVVLPDVNHKNGRKHDNRLSNLEWVDRSGNNLHAYRTGLREPPRFAVVGESLRDGSIVRFESQRDAEIALSRTGKQSSAISHCFSGKKKSAYGYRWRRA